MRVKRKSEREGKGEKDERRRGAAKGRREGRAKRGKMRGGGRKKGGQLEQTGTNVPSLITLVIHLTT